MFEAGKTKQRVGGNKDKEVRETRSCLCENTGYDYE